MSLRMPGKNPPVLSLLDRLLEEPQSPSLDTSPSQVLRKLMDGVCRDLQNLLNSHRRPVPGVEGDSELLTSILCYGIPDFTNLNHSVIDNPHILISQLENAITSFEPRLRNVRVVLERPPSSVRTLRFRIEGVLCVSSVDEEYVSFTSVIDPTTGKQQVQEASNA